jgi:uncharacterized membrane-anchored protein
MAAVTHTQPWLVFGFALLFAPASALAQGEPSESAAEIEWSTGSGQAKVGKHAHLELTPDYAFTGPKGTIAILESMENPTSGDELGLAAPTDTAADWFVVFEFDESGYVKDDEKDKLDADKILQSIREGTAEANKERKKRGWTEMEIVGWHTPPRYNATTNNLEWAVLGRAEGHEVVNYSTRILGRRGVMHADLVVDAAALDASLPAYAALIDHFEYNGGEAYADWKKGDPVAAYGLTALVAGGAGVALAKSGLLGKIWKFLALGAVAVVGAVAKFFRGRKENEGTTGTSGTA